MDSLTGEMIFPLWFLHPMPGIRGGKVGSSSLCWNSCSQGSSSALQLVPCSSSISCSPDSAESCNSFLQGVLEQKAQPCPSHSQETILKILTGGGRSQHCSHSLSFPPILNTGMSEPSVPVLLVVPSSTSSPSGSLLQALGDLWHSRLLLDPAAGVLSALSTTFQRGSSQGSSQAPFSSGNSTFLLPSQTLSPFLYPCLEEAFIE